jgi:tight adherence protein C
VGLLLLLTSAAQPLGRPKPDLAAALRRLDVAARLRDDALARPPGGARPLFDLPVLERALRPALDDLGRAVQAGLRRLGLHGLPGLGRLAGGAELERQLALVWPELGPAQFAGWKVATGCAGPAALAAIALLGFRPAGGWPLWLWGGLFALGFLAPDWDLARRLGARREAVRDELPTVLELLALATTAGQGLEHALRLVAGWGQGMVAGALRGALQEAALGQRPLGAALEALAAREALPELEAVAARLRAVHEQGLPLAESVAALADALRERRRLDLEAAGGRATVRMLVPVALLILPVVGIVLLFPAVVEIWGLAG